jgi:hypothetical protein
LNYHAHQPVEHDQVEDIEHREGDDEINEHREILQRRADPMPKTGQCHE